MGVTRASAADLLSAARRAAHDALNGGMELPPAVGDIIAVNNAGEWWYGPPVKRAVVALEESVMPGVGFGYSAMTAALSEKNVASEDALTRALLASAVRYEARGLTFVSASIGHGATALAGGKTRQDALASLLADLLSYKEAGA